MVDAGPFARIAISVPLKQLFDYRVPAELSDRVVPGMRVKVRFHNRRTVGYCIERTATSEIAELLDIEDALDDEPILDDHLLSLARWTADYYHASLGEVIEAAVPKGVRRAPRSVRWVRLVADAEVDDDKRGDHEARRRALDTLAAAPDHASPATVLREDARASESTIQTLAKRGLVEIFEAPILPAERQPLADFESKVTPPELTAHQRTAVDAILGAVDARRYETFLLHGVTGSGKTEVYIRAIEAVLAAGGSALVLVPEIALTPQTVARFRERLGEVAVLHSMLPESERAAAHRDLRDGHLRVAIGARSAVFAPLTDLGIVVVDESHESTYKQESTPRYHARDVAVKRASMLGIPCLLGSATPSMESFENAALGRYTLERLPERVTGHPLAAIEIVDRRNETADRRTGAIPLLSERLIALLDETVRGGEQAILFLNRRGFARHIHCIECGFALRCSSCDIGLTYHKRVNRSLCHYCGTERLLPSRCPDCSRSGIRRSIPGTERIEEILGRLFPDVAIDRLDRDTASHRDRLVEILDRFRRGETRILVGTQMVAKGHDIPGVTLVGVIDADIALGLPDFRAAERTAQLICQVAGRAGRGAKPGRVVIQTRQPDHYAIEAGRSQDLEKLFAAERASRKMLGYPPFGYLVRCVCEDTNEETAEESASLVGAKLREAAAKHDGVRVLGPAPAPLARLRTWYRFHILLKGSSRKALREVADAVAWKGPQKHTTRLVVDVDPQSLM